MTAQEPLPFSPEEADQLIAALMRGDPGTTEFQALKFMMWAANVRKSAALLELILQGRFDVLDVKHSVDESCEFMVKLRRSVGAVE